MMIQIKNKEAKNAYFSKTNPIEVAYSLKGLEYPVDKEGLLRCAQENDAKSEVIQVIKQLPNKHYHTPIEISKEISNIDRYLNLNVH
jgi:hypothetical protein